MFKLIKGLEQPGQGEAKPAQLWRAVFWSFFGVRKKKDLDNDSAKITPLQVIGAGLIGALIFVMTLLALVYFITH
ncbi:MAG: DUF2970 domain-containing protein [Burkholderiales bacterium]